MLGKKQVACTYCAANLGDCLFLKLKKKKKKKKKIMESYCIQTEDVFPAHETKGFAVTV